MKTSEKIERRLDGCSFTCEGGGGDDLELVAEVAKLEADSEHLDAILQVFRDDGYDEDIVYSISKYCKKHGLPIND